MKVDILVEPKCSPLGLEAEPFDHAITRLQIGRSTNTNRAASEWNEKKLENPRNDYAWIGHFIATHIPAVSRRKKR